MKNDLDLLQGLWSVTNLEVEGQKTTGAILANARVEIKGSRFSSTGMGSVYEGTLKLDAAARPRQLDMTFDAGPEKGNTNLGIYELKGDTWKLCLATRGKVRPRGFASTPGSGFAFEILKRGEAAVPAKAKEKARSSKKTSATELEGEWRMVSGIMNGQAMKESDVKWVKRVTQGNQTTVYAGPQVMLSVEFTSDSSKSPKTIDYVSKGKTQRGIYEFEGGVLKICVAAPGSPRPAEFKSVPGDGRTLTAWKRG